MKCGKCGEETRNGDEVCPACRHGVIKTSAEEELERAQMFLDKVRRLGDESKSGELIRALEKRIEMIRRRIDETGKSV